MAKDTCGEDFNWIRMKAGVAGFWESLLLEYYKKQFDRLEYILRYQRENPLTVIKRIDLSMKGWAPVKIETKK